MGAVKNYYHDIIIREPDEEFPTAEDELEILAMDAQSAAERYEAALKKHNENDHGSDKTTPAV